MSLDEWKAVDDLRMKKRLQEESDEAGDEPAYEDAWYRALKTKSAWATEPEEDPDTSEPSE